MSELASWRILPLLALCLLLIAVASPASAAKPYRRGETVRIQGSVVDAAGQPLADLTVVLVAAKKKLALGSLERREEGVARVVTKTDSRGRFDFDWEWNPYYNAFRLQAEMKARTDEGRVERQVLERVDLTRRIRQGDPVVVSLEIDDASGFRDREAFLAGLRSDDQREVYEQMGKPDRVERLELARGEEVAWWYFAIGKSYHFLDGRLQDVMDFDPVKPF